MTTEQAKAVEQCGNDEHYYCPGETTARILKKFRVSHADALAALIGVLRTDHGRFEDALRYTRRIGEAAAQGVCGARPPHKKPVIEQTLDAVLDAMGECGTFLDVERVVDDLPVGPDGKVDKEYKTLAALHGVLEAAVADTRREIARLDRSA